MVNADKVEGILANLYDYLAKLTTLSQIPFAEFAADFTKVESAKHLLQVSVECCLNLSHHIIADRGFRTPASYAESFEILAEHGIVPSGFLPALQTMARF